VVPEMRIINEKLKDNKSVEDRITMEIIVDAYNEEERAMGWYYYLQGKITFPFLGECIEQRSISPLKSNQRVTVIGMASEDECLHEMFVETEYNDESLCIPLAQITPISKDENTRQAV
jgi:hypothetical protein